MGTDIFGYRSTLLLQNAKAYVEKYCRRDIPPYLKYLDAMEATMRKKGAPPQALRLVKMVSAYTDFCDG